MSAHILVVNDSPELLDFFAGLLTDEGYLVSTERCCPLDAQEAIRLRPDLIVADYPHPAYNPLGAYFLRKLQEMREIQPIPLIVCTTIPQILCQVERWLEGSDVVVLPKPFTIPELLQTIRARLS